MLSENRERNRSSWLRSIYNYTMGVLWLAVGIFVLFHQQWGYDLKLDEILQNILGVSCVLYGLFRIYRGFKKQ